MLVLRLITCVLFLGVPVIYPVFAEVVSVEVHDRQILLDGREFGTAGSYEKISGLIRFSFDPENPANRPIVDIDHAPKDADGNVGAIADFMVLKPLKPRADHDVAMLEVSNRGGKASLRYFNNGTRFARNPETAADFGDGLLMRLGYTVIWIGWQFDVPPESDNLRLRVPIATEAGRPITGLVRSDWVIDSPLRTLPLAHRDHIAYPVLLPSDPRNVLTIRTEREGQRDIVPRKSWQFAREENGKSVPDQTHIHMPDGFQQGGIYELVYVSEHPRVAGFGLAAIRDTMSYAKYDSASIFPAKHGVAFGVSQTGRFLRHFLYQGFNEDESRRRVFDGMLIHTAGAGRGSFNHRFGQPSRPLA